ncbi:MAG: hypothetical protein H6739_18610 [Alphaproteobacteria bacterium]|nr:hypothetical protein [Alphaproteobacteria bacterium]
MSDETNPYALFPEESMDRRPRYYDGQFLGSAEFIDEQRYHVDRQRRHVRALTSAGVLSGYNVTSPADGQVRVEPGDAFDSSGRQLLLLEAEDVPVTSALYSSAQHLVLTYAEEATDVSAKGEGIEGATRFLEKPAISFVLVTDAVPDDAVVIARLDIDAAGRVDVDTTVRSFAGVLLPGTDNITVRSSGETLPGQATIDGNVRVDGKVGIGGDANSANLAIYGNGSSLELGAGVAGKEQNAGKIGYQAFGAGDALSIVGAGSNGSNRKVRIFAEGRLTVTGPTTQDGALTVSGVTQVNNSARITGGLRVGQTGAAGYGGVTEDGNDLVVNGQLAAGGSAGSAIFSLSIGEDAQSGKEGQLFVNKTIHVTDNSERRGLAIGGAKVIELGAGISGKQQDAGKIGYGTWTVGALDIIGAGTSGSNRSIKLWSEGGLTVAGPTTISHGLTVQQGDANRVVSLAIQGTKAIELGAGENKGGDTTAGRIGCRLWSDGLDIIGIGTSGSTRQVMIHAQGRLDILGPTHASGDVNVATDANVGGNLNVTGLTKVDGVLELSGGDDASHGLVFNRNHADQAYIRWDNNTSAQKLIIGIEDDASDLLVLRQDGSDRVTIGSNKVRLHSLVQADDNMTVAGTLTVSENVTFAKGLNVGQTSNVGYGSVTNDGNDMVVNGQFAAGGSGGAAMYSLSIGMDAQNNQEGRLYVNKRIYVADNSEAVGLSLAGKKAIELGAGVSGKQADAGKIGYGTFTAGVLDIVGGGTDGTNRKIKLWAEGGVETTGNVRVEGWMSAQNAYLDGVLSMKGGTSVDTGIHFNRSGTDYAYVRHHIPSSGNQTLYIGIENDSSDKIILRQTGADRVVIGDNKVKLNNNTEISGTLSVSGAATLSGGVSGNLSVSGRVLFGAGYGVSTQWATMIAWAIVKSNGTLWKGHGIQAVSRLSTGHYEVQWEPNFTDKPCVVVTQQWPKDTDTFNDGGGNTKDGAVVIATSTHRCQIKTGESDGSSSDRCFHLIAIGPM